MIHKASYGDGMVVLSIKVGSEVWYVFEAHFPVVLGGGIVVVRFLCNLLHPSHSSSHTNVPFSIGV